MNLVGKKKDFLKKYEDPIYVNQLKDEKIKYLQNKIKDLSSEQLGSLEYEIENLEKNKNIQESKQEIEFNEKLHELNLKNIEGNNALEEANLNKIIPSIRIQYIRSWKNFIAEEDDKGLNKAKEMEKVISKFDKILEEKQRRDQKTKVFNNLILFFGIETLILFFIVVFNNKYSLKIPDTTLNILIGATISQVAMMLTTVVYNLYPKEEVEKIFSDYEKINKFKEEK